MSCYIISYDLRTPGRNYDALYEAIKLYGTWAHINESLWVVVTNKTAVQVRDHLAANVNQNDRAKSNQECSDIGGVANVHTPISGQSESNG